MHINNLDVALIQLSKKNNTALCKINIHMNFAQPKEQISQNIMRIKYSGTSAVKHISLCHTYAGHVYAMQKHSIDE